MNTNEDKHIEKLVDQMMKNQTLETPSFDFTTNIMNKVLESKKPQAFVYKPLIPRKIFISILTGMTILILCSLFYDAPQAMKWVPHIDFISMSTTGLIENFRFSKIATYSIVLTTVMLFIQIPLLKNYFERRYNP